MLITNNTTCAGLRGLRPLRDFLHRGVLFLALFVEPGDEGASNCPYSRAIAHIHVRAEEGWCETCRELPWPWRAVSCTAVMKVRSERKKGFSTELDPVPAYGGGYKNLKDPKESRVITHVHFTGKEGWCETCAGLP